VDGLLIGLGGLALAQGLWRSALASESGAAAADDALAHHPSLPARARYRAL
jgi:hypothetical protein